MFTRLKRATRVARARRLRSAGAVLAATTVLAAGLVGTVGTPAYADEPGLFCTVASRAKLSASPGVALPGEPVTVRWDLQLNDCPEPVFYIVGPGFGGDIAPSGSRQVPFTPDWTGTSTWTLYLFDVETDNHIPTPMATATVYLYEPH